VKHTGAWSEGASPIWVSLISESTGAEASTSVAIGEVSRSRGTSASVVTASCTAPSKLVGVASPARESVAGSVGGGASSDIVSVWVTGGSIE